MSKTVVKVEPITMARLSVTDGGRREDFTYRSAARH